MKLKYRNAFTRFYLTILMLALIISVLFSVFIYKTYIQNFSDSHGAANEAILNQAVGETDNAIRQLHESVLSITKDPSIVKAVVTPSIDDAFGNNEIAQRLDNTVTNFNYINKIFLYENTNGTLFSSDEFVGDKNASKYKRLIDTCLSSTAACFDQSVRQSARIISANGKLYMVCGFVPVDRQFLGTLICEINHELLFKAIQNTTENNRYVISIMTDDNVHLFSSDNPENAKVYEELSRDSELTGWNFTLYTTDPVNYSFEDYIRHVLPFMLLIILIAIVLSFAVTSFIYSPIDKLITLIRADDEAEESALADSGYCAAEDNNLSDTTAVLSGTNAGNEFNMLAETYSRLSKNNKITGSFISEIRPDLEASILKDIVTDPESQDLSDISRQLKLLGSRLNMEGCFQSFLIKLTTLETAENVLHYAIGKHIFSVLTDLYSQRGCDLFMIFFHQDTLAFLASYKQDIDAESREQLESSITTVLHSQFSESGFDTITAAGSVRTKLIDVSVSYREAKEKLRKYIYYGQNTSESITDHISEQNNDDMLLNKLRNSVENGDIAESETISSALLDKMCRSSLDTAAFISKCLDIIDIFTARLYIVPKTGAESNSEYAVYYEKLEKITDKEDAVSYMRQILPELTADIKSEYSKSQHRIIASAREYIHAHYSDSSLEIHQIADSIGITDTYLSSVFTKYTGENLVTYMNRFRVDMARELLLNTKIIIKDVGYRTGFYTVQNFNRVFKRYTGVTPGEYRKQR